MVDDSSEELSRCHRCSEETPDADLSGLFVDGVCEQWCPECWDDEIYPAGEQRARGLIGFQDRSYLLLAFGIPVFFVLQTIVFAVAPFRMGTSTLGIQFLGLGFIWAYSVYHALTYQGYLAAFRKVMAR